MGLSISVDQSLQIQRRWFRCRIKLLTGIFRRVFSSQAPRNRRWALGINNGPHIGFFEEIAGHDLVRGASFETSSSTVRESVTVVSSSAIGGWPPVVKNGRQIKGKGRCKLWDALPWVISKKEQGFGIWFGHASDQEEATSGHGGPTTYRCSFAKEEHRRPW